MLVVGSTSNSQANVNKGFEVDMGRLKSAASTSSASTIVTIPRIAIKSKIDFLTTLMRFLIIFIPTKSIIQRLNRVR